MKNIRYKVEYNPTTKTWNVFKYIESEHSFNFYSVFESESKKECKEYLDNLKEGKASENIN